MAERSHLGQSERWLIYYRWDDEEIGEGREVTVKVETDEDGPSFRIPDLANGSGLTIMISEPPSRGLADG